MFIPSRPQIAMVVSDLSRLLGLGSDGPVTQSQPPSRAELRISTRPVTGERCELRFGCCPSFDPRTALLDALGAFLRRIGRIAGFVLERENSSHPFERIYIGKIC